MYDKIDFKYLTKKRVSEIYHPVIMAQKKHKVYQFSHGIKVNLQI